jgi:plasmid stabilization system protein ParE
MTATYRLTRSARRDLQAISDFWTVETGEDAALKVLGGVIETIITISFHPQAGIPADKFGARVRKFPAGKYMVYYRTNASGIEVLHVFHGARDQRKAWRKRSVRRK